jgi:hypothetical protein
LGASLGLGLLLKSLIGVLFPLGAGLFYLFITRQLFRRETWRRFRPLTTIAIAFAIAAPWHIAAALHNPPYFSFTLRSGPGQYHGFLWFFFINEQLLRFLNIRYPRDYNTVPRLYFWVFNLVWLFPWSIYSPALVKLRYRADDRAGRTRLLALCWIGFVLVFFTFSTTQEYYLMPCYPAFALLLGSAMPGGSNLIRRGTRALSIITAAAGLAALVLLYAVRNIPTPGDISVALSSHPDAYTLSLGHMLDLTFRAFAYLRLPLLMAAVAFSIGAVANAIVFGRWAFLSSALMMILFFQAARLAMITFDPYMSSHALAEALLRAPPGKLIVDHNYYTYSSVFFYTNRRALLLNGRRENIEYGSYAPGAPDVFIDDAQWQKLWFEAQRYYLVASDSEVSRLEATIGRERLQTLTRSGGKMLVTNLPLSR